MTPETTLSAPAPPAAADDARATSGLLYWARAHDPALAAELPGHLCRAEQFVATNLASALIREGLAPAELTQPMRDDVGFARGVPGEPLWRGAPVTRAVSLLRQSTLAPSQQLRDDVSDCVANLALTCAVQRVRGRSPQELTADVLATHGIRNRDAVDPNTTNLLADQLNVAGHNVHPLGRLRRGVHPAEALAYTAECRPTAPVMLRVIAVNRKLLRQSSTPGVPRLSACLEAEFPQLATDRAQLRGRAEYDLVPLHPWQHDHMLGEIYAAELLSGDIVLLPTQIPATPTTSLRTLVTDPGRRNRRLVIKTAVNVWLTSTRRDISPASTVNGPKISRIVTEIVATEPLLRGRVGVVGELAGSCFAPPHATDDTSLTLSRARGLSAVLRADLTGHVAPGQLAVSASSLCADSPLHTEPLLIDLVARAAHVRGGSFTGTAREFLRCYADCLAPAMVVLLSGYGIGLEAHLQNTLVVIGDDYLPRRVLLRDFGGIRVHLPRLRAAGYRYQPYPGSLTASDKIEPVRVQTYYACLQANLAEIVLTVVTHCGVAADDAWHMIWGRLDRAWAQLEQRADTRGACRADRDAARTSTALQKAFVTMANNPARGNSYIAVPNPLHDAARAPHTVPRP